MNSFNLDILLNACDGVYLDMKYPAVRKIKLDELAH